MHWVPKSVLYLSKDEGGLGLIHLQSRTAAFRLQYVQRLLQCSSELSWMGAACAILRNIEGLGLDKTLFWLDSQRLKLSNSPVFYRNLFKVWSLFKKNRESNGASLYFKNHWLVAHVWTYHVRFRSSYQKGLCVMPS